MDESWLPIPGFTGYEASDQGRIRSFRTGIKNWDGPVLPVFLSLRKDPAGYVRVALRADGRTKHTNHYVHRLVAAAWLGPCPPGWEVHHDNHIRHDNRPENLKYETVAANRSKRRARKKIRCPHCNEELW